jgi:hypothetical protein
MSALSSNNKEAILEQILSSIGLKFVIIDCKCRDEENFSVDLKTEKLPAAGEYKEQCNEWVNRFSMATNTQWITRNTHPNPTRKHEYSKLFVCQHSSFNKAGSSVQRPLQSNSPRLTNKHCDKATINISVKRDPVDTLKKDPHLREGLFLRVKVSNKFLVVFSKV